MSPNPLTTRLGCVPRDERPLHLPASVTAAVAAHDIEVFPVPDDASDTGHFAARYGIGLDDCANTIVVKYRKDAGEHHAAIVTLGSRRLDVNGAVKTALGAQRLSFAKREDAVARSGMEFGGITAFGLPEGWRVLVDAAVLQRPLVVMGAGVRRSKLLLAPNVLLSLPSVTVATLTVDG